MTLSDARVVQILRTRFLCGWRNIQKEPQAGASNDHAPGNRAAQIDNGSGFHNVQLFVLTPEGRVVHCLPGFWNPDLLLKELDFALTLIDLWKDRSLSLVQKAERFADAHLAHMREHAGEDMANSSLPSFDRYREQQKSKSDAVRPGGEVKKADQIVHERMAERPFMLFKDFDTAVFADVGERFYDAGTDG